MQLIGDSLISSEDALIQYLESHVASEITEILDARFGTLTIRMSCVQLAACFGWTDALKMLLDENGPYNCKGLMNCYDSHGHTPLLGACTFGQADAVMILLEHGANAALNHLANGISPLHYLVELTRNRSCVRNDLYDIAFSLVSAGADPNAPFFEQESGDTVQSDLDQKSRRESMRFQYRVPLSRAIWLGDVEAVKCLLHVGAIPDSVCLEMAVLSHQVDAFEVLLGSDSELSRSFNIDGPTSLGTTLLGLALDENENNTPITPLTRTLLSKQSPSDSAMSMVQCLLRHGASTTLGSSDDDGKDLHWLWYLAIKDKQVDNRVMEVLWQQAPAELEDSSEGFNLLECSLLHSKTDMAHFLLRKGSDPTKWSDIELNTLHLCAAYTDDASLCRKLLERYQHPDIEADHGGMGTDITTAFQLAVAHQHFGVADCLHEAGSNRDYAATDPKDSDRNKTLLGWLLEDVWSESQVRIEYLFERYPDEALPAFIVRPIVCWSALQAAAHRTPRNTLEETDAGNLMEYMLSKYRGGLHVEYERVNKKEREKDIAQGSGTIRSGFESYNDTSARKQDVDPTFFQHQLGATGWSDDEPDLNNYGTALHFAVRAVNFPAVQALIRAGAKASPTLGPQKRGRIYTDSYEGIYTSKVDNYASTPLDYAILTHERLQQGTWPRCFGADKLTPAAFAHLQGRSRDIIQFLTQVGASNGSKYIRKRGEANVWKERREKGNMASMRMFGNMLKKDISFAKGVFQKAYKEGLEDLAIDYKKIEDRAKTKFEAETGSGRESDSDEQTAETE